MKASESLIRQFTLSPVWALISVTAEQQDLEDYSHYNPNCKLPYWPPVTPKLKKKQAILIT